MPEAPDTRTRWTLPGEVSLILAAGLVLGLGANRLSPHPAYLSRAVYPTSSSGPALCGAGGGDAAETRPEKIAMMKQADAVVACNACTAGFVDARGAAAYAAGHLPGAIHLPPVGHDDERTAIEALRGFSLIVVYDDGAGCKFARGVARRLRDASLADVRVLEGGWVEWQAAGGPAQSGACGACEGPAHMSHAEDR